MSVKPFAQIEDDLLPFKKEHQLFQFSLGTLGKFKTYLLYCKDNPNKEKFFVTQKKKDTLFTVYKLPVALRFEQNQDSFRITNVEEIVNWAKSFIK